LNQQMGRGGCIGKAGFSTIDEVAEEGGRSEVRDLLNNRMLQLKKASLGGQTNMTNGMDEFLEFNQQDDINSLQLTKTGANSHIQQSNANLSRLAGASRFTTVNVKANRPLIPKPPTLEAQKAAI
jgi:hypothetical protein